MSSRRNSSESLPAARATSSMKHSRYTPFWFVLTPRQGPTGTWVLPNLQTEYAMRNTHVPAPGADRNVGVAHCVLDLQVGHRIAELRVAGLFPHALQLAHVLAFLDRARVQPGVDRLAGDADVHADELAAFVQSRAHLALRDRPIEIVRLVFLAAPDQLHRDAGKLLRDRDRLAGVVLRAAAASESAAEVELVHLALFERQPRFLAGRGERAFRALRRRPHFDAVRRHFGHAVHGLHRRVREERRAVDRLD